MVESSLSSEIIQLDRNKTFINIESLYKQQRKNFCVYCHGKRKDQENLPNFNTGFVSTKMRADDLERILNAGFARFGNHFYYRDNKNSCCEYYPYKVDFTKFKIDKN